VIVQILLDAMSLWLSGFITLLPAVPAVLLDALNSWQLGMAYIVEFAAPYGFIVPLATISYIVNWWVGWLGFWVAMQGVRLLLWIAGR